MIPLSHTSMGAAPLGRHSLRALAYDPLASLAACMYGLTCHTAWTRFRDTLPRPAGCVQPQPRLFRPSLSPAGRIAHTRTERLRPVSGDPCARGLSQAPRGPAPIV